MEREKSRTPKEERTNKDQTKKKEKIEKAAPKRTQETKKPIEGKKLDFKEDDVKDADADSAQQHTLDLITPDKAKPAKKARFEESDEEIQEGKTSEGTATNSKDTKTSSKNDTPHMELTTQRLESMTVSTPVRGDGTKTPLRIPPAEIQRHRKASSYSATSEESEDAAMASEDEAAEQLNSMEDLQKAIQGIQKKQKQKHEETDQKLQELTQTLQEVNYDVESHARINAHLLHTKLQADAREASLSITIEGFPKESSEHDRRTFAEWVLQAANNKDRSPDISLFNTRGELSNFINIRFSSGYLRNQMFQWFIENYVHKRQRLYWWSTSSQRESNHEIRIRKALSEDARLRGRLLKAAMESLNEAQGPEVNFYPAWGENAIREKETRNYLIWLHFSYATATCEVFIDEPFFQPVADNFENKLAEISKNVRKGKGTGKSNLKTEVNKKGTSKGTYAALDYSFDSKTPFWFKFVQVHNWRNNARVQQALREEEDAQSRIAPTDG